MWELFKALIPKASHSHPFLSSFSICLSCASMVSDKGPSGHCRSTWGKARRKQAPVWVLQEGPRQVGSNNHNSLRSRSAPFPLAPGTHADDVGSIFKTAAHPGRRAWGQEKLKATKVSSGESVSFFLIKHSSGCCKSLTSFQSSNKIDFDSFCQLIHCFCRGMVSWGSYPRHFATS